MVAYFASGVCDWCSLVTQSPTLRWAHAWYTKSPTYQPSSCLLSKMGMCVPLKSGVSEIAACPPSHFADNPAVLPSLTSTLSSSQELVLPVHSMAALYASCSTELLNFSRYCDARFKMLSLFFVCVLCLFLCIICVKRIINHTINRIIRRIVNCTINYKQY